MKPSIYLDHAATSPIRPEAAAVYMEAMQTLPGNPSSVHSHGREARKRTDDARRILAGTIHAAPGEIVFTSGGTEADNYAIAGTAGSRAHLGRHIITTAIEHHAVLNTCGELERHGFEVTYLQPDRNGRIDAGQVADALRDDTILVSVMYGNNEVGTIQPIREIGGLLDGHQALFHTDAVQAYGMLPIDVQDLQVDLLSVSAHKVNGPKGIGFLYQRRGIDLKPLLTGGSQERKRRAGTENVPAILAFSEAARLAAAEQLEKSVRCKEFETAMMDVFDAAGVKYRVNVIDGVPKLPHIANFHFPGTDIESLLVNLDLDGVSVSSGSACTAGSLDPSHVLVAMFGGDSPELRSSVRFSFGYGTTEADVREAAERTARIIGRTATTTH
ncbi:MULTISPECIES: cysteine desulfurase family protein [Sporosarcina]|uniref:cysteine desulfurase family protein n=1 Tax=Sporosarcina TaxID=1569 RepID=UPI00058DD963|nr:MULTISPECIES: cysteine desulfurase family protein [Sporosarcina]WJY28546.1 cysteine desulfurase family protein [Sporosarcina sp. 0.2-SM1T-5]